MFMTHWRPICWAFCTIRYQDVTEKMSISQFWSLHVGICRGVLFFFFSSFFYLFIWCQDRWWWNVSNAKHFQSIPFRSNTFHHSMRFCSSPSLRLHELKDLRTKRKWGPVEHRLWNFGTTFSRTKKKKRQKKNLWFRSRTKSREQNRQKWWSLRL